MEGLRPRSSMDEASWSSRSALSGVTLSSGETVPLMRSSDHPRAQSLFDPVVGTGDVSWSSLLLPGIFILDGWGGRILDACGGRLWMSRPSSGEPGLEAADALGPSPPIADWPWQSWVWRWRRPSQEVRWRF